MESKILSLYRNAVNEGATSFHISMDICQSETEIRKIFRKYNISVDIEKNWGSYTVSML